MCGGSKMERKYCKVEGEPEMIVEVVSQEQPDKTILKKGFVFTKQQVEQMKTDAEKRANALLEAMK